MKIKDSLRGLLLIVTFHSALMQQSFVTEPQDAETIQGGTVILRCVIDNLRGPVQWVRDGFALGFAIENGQLQGYPRYSMIGASESGTFNLMISNAQLEDDGYFQCQIGATETSAGMMSRKAKHNVLLPPDQPSIVNGSVAEVVANQPTNLTCHANNGKPAPNITWFTGSTQLTSVVTVTSLQDDGKREDAVSYLELTPRKIDQARVYECHALNAALLGQPVKEKVALEVLYIPEVTMSVEPSLKIVEGEAVTFTCEANANPSDVTWKWFREEEEMTGETAASMKIPTISRDLHMKAITCEAKNKVGSTKRNYNLQIQYGPRFRGAAEHVAVDPGEDAVLRCDVDANPAPGIYWTRRSPDSASDDGKILSSSPTLQLQGVSEAQFGIYTCTASAIGFDEIKMDVHLLMKGPPYITSAREQSAKFGDTGIIECVIHSAPEPTSIVWKKDGKVMDLNDIPRYVMRSEELPGGVRSVIEITSVQDADFATYNCSVENGYGKTHMLIEFSQREVIPLAYILGGVLAGIVILIIAGVILFVYLRKRGSGSESGSESSEDSLKRDDTRNDPQPEKFDSYPIDAWKTDPYNNDQRYYRLDAEYDELNYHNKDHRMNKSYDVADSYGYGNQGYNDRRGPGDYGTYPGPARIYDNRFNQENPYGPANAPSIVENPYGTHGSTYAPSVAPSVHSEYSTYRGPDYAPGDRLATNV